jgi:uncharacterized repeat protein (TIGR01451 family)
MKKIPLLFMTIAIIAIGFAGWNTQAAQAAGTDPAINFAATTSSYTFINNIPTGCPASWPSCNVPFVGGGNMYFSTAKDSAGKLYEDVLFYSPEYTGSINSLIPTITQTVYGTPGCNATNQYTLTVPSTNVTDAAGRNIEFGMVETLTQYFSNAAGKGGGGGGCHWEALNGTTTLILNNSTTAPVAGLAIAQTVDNAAPLPDNPVNYTLLVTAQGPATSTMVTVNDLLSTGIIFVGATSSMGSYNATSGIWTIGDMTPSSTVMLNIEAIVNASDTPGQIIVNAAVVGESAIDTNPNAAHTSSSVAITVGTSSGNGTTTIPLTAPTGLTGAPTPTSIALSWTASTGGIAPITYTVMRDGTSVGTTTGTMFIDKGLSASTTYVYVIQATDSATPTANTISSSEISLTTSHAKTTPGCEQNDRHTPPGATFGHDHGKDRKDPGTTNDKK